MYRDYVDFDVTVAKKFTIIEEAYFDRDTKELVSELRISNPNRGETEVSIRFTQPVDRVRAEDTTNYLFSKTVDGKVFDVADLDGRIIVESNGKEVTLVIPNNKIEGKNFLNVLESLRDKDNNRLEGKRQFQINKLEDPTPTPPTGDFTAEATKGATVLGLTEYEIKLEGAELKDIEDVLVNGDSKVNMADFTDGVYTFRSDVVVETISVVVDGKTVVATIK